MNDSIVGLCASYQLHRVTLMNAPSFSDHRNAIPARDLPDDKMNQVRDLLVGDLMRTNEARIGGLDDRLADQNRASDARMGALEARMRDLETGIGQRLTLLHQRIETLAADHTTDRQAAFEELAKSVLELGDRIRGLSR